MSEAAAKRDTVCFTVTGEFLTDFARTRVIEGRWDHGLRTLVEGLHGMTTDQAISILKGDQKLIGDSDVGVDMVPDNDTEHKAQLAYHFAGTFVDGLGRHMRPYAVVTSWGLEDMSNEFAYKTAGTRAKNRYTHTSEFYADREADVCREVRLPVGAVAGYPHERGDVLFKEVANFPVLVVQAGSLNDPQAAVEAYLGAGRSLGERGHARLFGTDIKFMTEAEIKREIENSENRRKTTEMKMALARRQAESPLKPMLDQFLEQSRQPERSLDSYREQIKAQAGDDTFDMEVEGKVHKVPRAPFEGWALNRTAWFHLKPEWKCVSPSGLKMIGDDPYHNDWMLGGDFDLNDYGFGGGTPLSSAAFHHIERVQRQYFNAEVPVLSGAGTVEGVIVHLKPGDRLSEGQVGVIKNAGPDYVQAAQDAITYGSALITEAGGAVAHLVTVFREQDLKIVRVPNARKVYPEGRSVTVYLTAGCIQVKDDASVMRMSNGAILKDGEIVGFDEDGL